MGLANGTPRVCWLLHDSKVFCTCHDGRSDREVQRSRDWAALLQRRYPEATSRLSRAAFATGQRHSPRTLRVLTGADVSRINRVSTWLQLG
jgi:hypothetical protein